jgi:two-component system CheB/CheR fusion protein
MDELQSDRAADARAARFDGDPAAPRDARARLPVVAIGGGAGGAAALEKFLAATAPDCGMAFVVILQRAPDEEDPALVERLQAATAMPVQRVGQRATLASGHVYLADGGHALELRDAELLRGEPIDGRGRRVAFDLFLRALADSHGPSASAVLLSGADADGAIGLKRIKEQGGLTVAQDPAEAGQDAMPRAALATGMVDWVLPAAEMPARLLGYRRIERRLRLPPEDGPQPTEAPRPADGTDEAALREVLAFVRSRTGRDFSAYKRATTLRRIARRMQVCGVTELPEYLACLRSQPGEVTALLQDLLISVTNFFRDPEAFAALQTHLPALFAGKGPGEQVRVWVAACATGEEAYTIAMLLAEHAATLEAPPAIQVFATDLDEPAIQVARSGVYPSTIEADVSAERLTRFFVREHRGYRVRRHLRETVLFSLHDLLRDSAFSRLDLVSCRNLMIYLTRAAQVRLLETFHFALRAHGKLFLGTSESVEEGDPLFPVLDKKQRIYARRPAARPAPPLPSGPTTLTHWVDAHLRAGGAAAAEAPPAWRVAGPAEAGVESWSELHLKLLEQIAPPSLVVNAEHQIVHLSDSAGRFLQFGAGEPTSNLLRQVDPALRIELIAALSQAAQHGKTAEVANARFVLDGAPRRVTIRVTPVPELSPSFTLVAFHVQPAGPEGTAEGPAAGAGADGFEPSGTAHDPMAVRLDREIERLNARLRDTVEQYETSTEELQASNEELQAMNEELRSATEELETGREELQSVNEELSTVNQELKSKVEELGSANSDMQNLMDATSIPTVFVDRELRISGYTPAAVPVFNLIPTDTGRPLTDLRTELDFPTLGADAARVLERLAPVEREISHADGSWYSVRMLPYRTIDNRIGGVVFTLLDITARRRVEMALRASEERLRLIVENAREYAIFSCDPERRVTSWNSGAERLLGYRESEVLGLSADLIFTPEDIAAGVPAREAGTALVAGRAGDDRFHQRKDGTLFWASGTMMPMRDDSARVVGFVKILRDQTDARRVQQALERSRSELLQAWHENEVARREAELQKEHLAALFTQAPAPICILRGPEHRVEFANHHMCRLWGTEQDEVVDKPIFEAVPGLRRAAFKDLLDGLTRTGVAQVGKEVPALLDRQDNGTLEEVYLNFTYAPLRGIDGRVDGVLVIAFDVTDEIRAREQMSELHEAAQAAGRAKDDFLAMLGHELRNPLAPLRTALLLLRRQAADKPVDPLLDVAERQAGNLARIVDDLLEAARITEGKIDLRLERIDLTASVHQALAATREFLTAHLHRVELSLPDEPLFVQADPVRMEQVIVNLLNNAGKYTPPGGRIEIALRRFGDAVELRVTDNGIGIPEDLRPRLFQLFQQGVRNLSREEGGLGIGLSVVRRLVELHGGKVEALSDGPGRGSSFIVRLPLAAASAGKPPEATPSPPETEATKAAAAAATPLRVLVVDDNRDAGDTLAMLVESMGHEVRLAGDGLQAIRVCVEWGPQAVFLDIGLPGMDGYEVARELRARLPKEAMPRLIAVTGYGQDRDREKTRAAGFDDHLVKPADFTVIASILNSVAADAAGARD